MARPRPPSPPLAAPRAIRTQPSLVHLLDPPGPPGAPGAPRHPPVPAHRHPTAFPAAPRSVSSSATPLGRQHAFQPFPPPHDALWSPQPPPPFVAPRERARSHRHPASSTGHGRLDDAASESAASVLSAFRPSAAPRAHPRKPPVSSSSSAKSHTDSPLRAFSQWLTHAGLGRRATVAVAVALVVLVKFLIGVGDYSGAGTPPMRGDFEAQRHWLSLTSSVLPSPPFYATSPTAVPLAQWYHHNLPYWGLDYPPLTAYHSLFLGALARLSPHTAPFVARRPVRQVEGGDEDDGHVREWETTMATLERDGDMKAWMRASVVASDAVWVSAVAWYCRTHYYGRARDGKGTQKMVVAMLTILLQPALLLIDNGHFQYNSVMLGLTLWSLNLFQANHHLLGAVAFVAALAFKQMALYYSPAIFAYLLGRCFYLGGRPGVSFLLHLSLVTLLSFLLVALPFLYPNPAEVLQVLHRVFPFARGLFEDKVANVWCVLNVAVKLRTLATVATLAKLAAAVTLAAVLPGVVGMVWVSAVAGKRESETSAASALDETKGDSPPPTTPLLPHALLASSLAFFLFSFQVHEKSLLLPLMPLTVLMGAREVGYGRVDWEWGVLVNNVGCFSMWPLLKRDGLGLQYAVLVLAWNWAIGYNPFALRTGFVKLLSLSTYLAILLLHALELLTPPPSHLPDLFAVLNVLLCAPVFGITLLWAMNRSMQEGWVVTGFR